MLGGDELIEYGCGADYLFADGPSLDDGDLEFLDGVDSGGLSDFPPHPEAGAGFLSRQR